MPHEHCIILISQVGQRTSVHVHGAPMLADRAGVPLRPRKSEISCRHSGQLPQFGSLCGSQKNFFNKDPTRHS